MDAWVCCRPWRTGGWGSCLSSAGGCVEKDGGWILLPTSLLPFHTKQVMAVLGRLLERDMPKQQAAAFSEMVRRRPSRSRVGVGVGVVLEGGCWLSGYVVNPHTPSNTPSSPPGHHPARRPPVPGLRSRTGGAAGAAKGGCGWVGGVPGGGTGAGGSPDMMQQF